MTRNLLLRDAHHEGGDQQAHDVRRLGGRPERVFSRAGIVPANRAASLHRVRNQPLIDDSLRELDLRLVDRRPDLVRALAAGPMHDDVVRRILVKLRCAFLGGLQRVHDSRKHFVVHRDPVHGIGSGLRILRHDNRDRIADLVDLADCQHPRRIDVVLDAARLPSAGQRVQIGEVLAGKDADHSRRRSGRGSVDGSNSGMAVGGS